MTFEECLEKGLIRKDPHAKNKVRQEYSLGKRFLKSARNNMRIEGYTERSHGCLFEALKVLYPEYKEMFSVASKIRLQRHNVQYNLGKVEKEMAEFTYSFAVDMSKKAKEILSL